MQRELKATGTKPIVAEQISRVAQRMKLASACPCSARATC
jgi:hypothetical protein